MLIFAPTLSTDKPRHFFLLCWEYCYIHNIKLQEEREKKSEQASVLLFY